MFFIMFVCGTLLGYVVHVRTPLSSSATAATLTTPVHPSTSTYKKLLERCNESAEKNVTFWKDASKSWSKAYDDCKASRLPAGSVQIDFQGRVICSPYSPSASKDVGAAYWDGRRDGYADGANLSNEVCMRTCYEPAGLPNPWSQCFTCCDSVKNPDPWVNCAPCCSYDEAGRNYMRSQP